MRSLKTYRFGLFHQALIPDLRLLALQQDTAVLLLIDFIIGIVEDENILYRCNKCN